MNQERGDLLPHIPESTPPGARVTFFRRLQPVTFAILSLAIVFLLYQLVAGGLTLLLFKGKVNEDNVAIVRWSTMIGQLLFILVPTLVLTRLRDDRPVKYLRVRVPDYREILLSVLAVFALQQMLQGYMVLQDAIPLPGPIQRYVDLIRRMIEETYRILVVARSPQEFVFVVVTVALIPAIGEELLFRGLVQRNFEEATGGLAGALITGVIFGAYHLNPISIVPLVVLGMYFGFIVYRSQNTVVSMSAHFFNNFIACAAAYMQLDDDFVAIAPGGKASAGLMVLNVILFGAVFVMSTYYYLRITEK